MVNKRPEVGDEVYRINDVVYAAPLNEFDELLGPSTVDIMVHTSKVTALTPKGFWVGYFGGKDRWVGYDHHKKFWHTTKKDAIQAYLARKYRQHRIIQGQLRRVQTAIKLGLDLMDKEE